MKNLITALLAVLLCMSLIACGKTGAVNNADSAAVSSGLDNYTTAPVVSLLPADEDTAPPSWTVNNSITFSLLQNTYPTGTQKITLVLENRGDSVLNFGEAISFEKYIDGEWKPVKTIANYGFNDIAHVVQPHSASTFTIDAWFVDKPLDAGLYRVTGSEVWTGETPNQRATYPAWQLEFRIADGAQPEPDFAVYISSVPLQTAEQIPAYIINTTGKDTSVLLIPRLERQDESGHWTEVPYADGIGFCGTSDPLSAIRSDAVPEMLWGGLAPGHYRLSYEITGDGTGPRIRTAGGEFVLAP